MSRPSGAAHVTRIAQLEARQLQVPAAVNQDVLGRQIATCTSLLVQMLQSKHSFRGVKSHPRLGELMSALDLRGKRTARDRVCMR
jgi:hypothetical protein